MGMNASAKSSGRFVADGFVGACSMMYQIWFFQTAFLGSSGTLSDLGLQAVESSLFFFAGLVAMAPYLFNEDLQRNPSERSLSLILLGVAGTCAAYADDRTGGSVYLACVAALLMGSAYTAGALETTMLFRRIPSFKERCVVIGLSAVLANAALSVLAANVAHEVLLALNMLFLPMGLVFQQAAKSLLPAGDGARIAVAPSRQRAFLIQTLVLICATVLLRAFHPGSLWGVSETVSNQFVSHPIDLVLDRALTAVLVFFGIFIHGKQRLQLRYRAGILILLGGLLLLFALDSIESFDVRLAWVVEYFSWILMKMMLVDAALSSGREIWTYALAYACRSVVLMAVLALVSVFSADTQIPLFILAYMLTLALIIGSTSYSGTRRRRDGASGEQQFEKLTVSVSSELGLSPRESEIFVLLVAGKNVAFVRERLHISEGTAKTHIKRIYKKLNVHSRQELVRFAVQNDMMRSLCEAELFDTAK